MGLHSGRWAQVNGVSTMRNWTINDAHTPAKATASNTKFGIKRGDGVHSWTGSVAGYGAVPAMMPGEIFGLIGYGAPTTEVTGANGQRYTGNAIVDSVQINWNFENGAFLDHVVNFSGHLALDIADGADPGDVTTPDTPPVALTKAQYKLGVGAYVDLPNVQRVTLTINNSNQSFVNSSTIVSGKLWTGRKMGAPMDCTVAITQQDDDRISVGMFNKGDNVRLKLFVNATEFWLIEFMMVRDFTGISYDREAGAIQSRTINFDHNVHDGTSYGQIALPDTSVWWPFA